MSATGATWFGIIAAAFLNAAFGFLPRLRGLPAAAPPDPAGTPPG
jgi:hypothetical protein